MENEKDKNRPDSASKIPAKDDRGGAQQRGDDSKLPATGESAPADPPAPPAGISSVDHKDHVNRNALPKEAKRLSTGPVPLPVPGDALVKMLRKNEILKQLKDDLKELSAVPGTESYVTEQTVPKESVQPGHLPKTGDVDESLFEPPCLKEMRIREIPYIVLPQYEEDPNVKPAGYPCGFDNALEYCETRESERLERKPDPSFIPPERFVAGVYRRLTCVAENEEKLEDKKKETPFFVSTRERFKSEELTAKQEPPVVLRDPRSYLRQFIQPTSELEIRYRKPFPSPVHKISRHEVVAAPVPEKKKTDESHLVISPNQITMDAPFTGRRLIYFRVKNDGKGSVAAKLGTSDNTTVEITNFCSILHAGDDKLFSAFYNPPPEDAENAAYKPLTISVKYASLDDLSRELRNWKSAELKVEFKFQTKLSEKSNLKGTSTAATREFGCGAINPFKHANAGDLSVIYKPFDEALKKFYPANSMTLSSEDSLIKRSSKKTKKTKTKKAKTVDERKIHLLTPRATRASGLFPGKHAELAMIKGEPLGAMSRPTTGEQLKRKAGTAKRNNERSGQSKAAQNDRSNSKKGAQEAKGAKKQETKK